MAQYSEETKSAVMAALLAGQNASEIAREYKVNPSTVRSWKREAGASNGVGQKKRERIGDLIIDNLEAGLETATEILRAVADEGWIRTQDASAIAVLYGVIQDKNYRILTALPDNDAQDTDL